jgi:protein-S-isoprenylcysteine O-methyltransferase Ste14
VRDIAQTLALPGDGFVRGAYWLLAGLNVIASALRIWAGGTLGGARMMAVNVQTDTLLIAGPYRHVRNPIYLADVLTLSGMGLVTPWPGLVAVIVLLMWVYPRVIAHEEANLHRAFGGVYDDYRHAVPRLTWSRRPWMGAACCERLFSWREGLANNFLYLPLIPGFVVCALTGVLWHGVAVGAVGPVAWVAVHFWRNFRKGDLHERSTASGEPRV